MKRLIVIIPFLILTAGCMAFYQPAPDNIDGYYYEQIKDWQKRIEKEGWAENLVDDVINKCVKFSKYQTEKKDHWDTPREFMQRGFKGDCEDFAIFMMATLKRLKYPYNVRVRAVKTLIGDHVVLRVEMPDEKWKSYETVPVPLDEIDRLFYRPIVEFDEKNIIFFERKSFAKTGS